MKRLNKRLVSTSLGLLIAMVFLTGPVFAQGAWKVKNDWNGKLADGTSYLEAFHMYAEKRSKEMYDQKIKLDCADMAITIYVEFAHMHNLKCSFYFPVWYDRSTGKRGRRTFHSTDAEFNGKGFNGFVKWARTFVGAQNLADNTYAIPVEHCRAGDVFLFDWNQSPDYPNFPGRDVWHTYVVGNDGAKTVYYGNLSGGNPLAIALGDNSTQKRIHGHPDRYGSGARRWKVFKKKPLPPNDSEVEKVEEGGKITADTLNVRRGPGTNFDRFTQLKKDEKIKVVGKYQNWLKVLIDGKPGWIHSKFVKTSPGILEEINRTMNRNREENPGSNEETPRREPENRENNSSRSDEG